MTSQKPRLVASFLGGWFLLYAALSLYPWFSEGIFWDFARSITLGQHVDVVREAVHEHRVLQFETGPSPQIGLSTNCVRCLGTIDPPRRMYLLLEDSIVVAKSPEVAEFTLRTDAIFGNELRWHRSYGLFLFRSFACCGGVFMSLVVFLRKRSRFIRCFAVLIAGGCLVLLLCDAVWLTLVYIRYVLLLSGRF